jgi:4-hydroxybenzoate polyprenyltransferase
MKHPTLAKRYYQYLHERFHPAQFTLLSLLIAAALVFGAAVIDASRPSLSTVFVAALALMLFLLRLRIFDEFKDHAHDTLHYPERPLPRGLISKNELRFMLVAVFLSEIMLLFFGGYWTAPLFYAALGYSLLMYKEFFLGTWLRKRFTLYVVSHELLLIPLFISIASFTVSDPLLFFTEKFAALLVFSGSQLFLLEVARKMRTAEHEVASRDTYTAQYGIRGAGTLLFITALFSVIGLILFEQLITNSTGILSLIGCASLLLFVIKISTFMRFPSARNASRLFHSAIFFFAITHIGFIAYAQYLFI